MGLKRITLDSTEVSIADADTLSAGFIPDMLNEYTGTIGATAVDELMQGVRVWLEDRHVLVVENTDGGEDFMARTYSPQSLGKNLNAFIDDALRRLNRQRTVETEIDIMLLIGLYMVKAGYIES